MTQIKTFLNPSPTLQKIFQNFSWLMVDKFVRLLLNFSVGIWVARYLGPQQFGILNYAIAFASLFSAAAGLGLEGILIREIVRFPDKKIELIGTSFFMRLFASVIGIGLICVSTWIRDPKIDQQNIMVFIVSFTLLFQAFEVIKIWFDSQIKSKFAVYSQSIALIISALAKITLIVNHASVEAFALVLVLESLLFAIALILTFQLTGDSILKWKFNWDLAKILLKDGWPLLISSVAILVYMRIDQIMLAEMIGDQELGIYSVAMRFTEVWYFIPIAMVSSVFPNIIKVKDSNEQLYYDRLQLLYNSITWIAIGISVPLGFISTPLVNLLFGEAYAGAGPIMAVHIWSAVFVFQGVARERWILVENLQRYTVVYILIGCALNIVLNLVLIPSHKGVGAALATLLSQACVAIFAPAIFKPTRLSSKMLIKAFFWRKAHKV